MLTEKEDKQSQDLLQLENKRLLEENKKKKQSLELTKHEYWEKYWNPSAVVSRAASEDFGPIKKRKEKALGSDKKPVEAKKPSKRKSSRPASEIEYNKDRGFLKKEIHTFQPPLDQDYEAILKTNSLKEVVAVNFQGPDGRLVPRDFARALLKKYCGQKSLEEKVLDHRKALIEGKPKEKKEHEENVSRALTRGELVAPNLVEHCATNVTDFCAIFLGQSHISKPFGAFHLELIKDLYNLTASKRHDNYAKELKKISLASDNGYYVKLSEHNAASARYGSSIPENKGMSPPIISAFSELEKVSNTSEIKSENLRSDEQAGAAGGGMGDQRVRLACPTSESFSDQNATSVSQINDSVYDLGLPYPDNIAKYERFDRLAIAAPRGHAKTTVVSVAFVLWCIVYKVHRFILLISDSEDQAKMLLDSVRHELEENEALRSTYGNLVGERIWGELAIETSTGVRIQTRGTGQKIRGLKYRSFRPSLVICDDLESDSLVETEEQRRKIKRWFQSALLPALDVDGKIVVIGTILHEDALLPELLSSWPSRIYAADKNKNPDCSEPLWPEAHSTQDLLTIKEDYANKGMADLFYREYFNQIVSPEDALFKPGNFKYITLKELTDKVDRGEKLRCFLTIDPAYVAASQRDYTVFCVAYTDSAHNLYIADILRGRYQMPQTVHVLFTLLEKYTFDGIGMQRVDWDKSFKIPVQTEMARRQKFFRVTPLQVYSQSNKGLANKGTRIARLAPRYEVGSIYHIKEAKGIRELEDELKSFPHSKYDDVADCLSMQLDLIFPAQKKAVKATFKYDHIADPVSGY